MTTFLDTRELRRALGQFATGVAVITTFEANRTPRGFTANSFTSVSLDPVLLLVCIANSASSRSVFCSAPNFSVNILSENQRDVSGLFATQRADKFSIVPWHCGPANTPLINGALAWFECARYNEIEAGDHVILIGQVKNFGYYEGRPLGYFKGQYFSLNIEDQLVNAAGRSAGTILGAIYENDGAVLLEMDLATGTVSIPATGWDGMPANLASLTSKFARTEMTTSIEFVYAVFEDTSSKVVSIYYRGKALGPSPTGTAYFKFSEIPWNSFKDLACRTMLQRYVNEAKQGAFAIYMGNESEGVVRPVGQFPTGASG